jgi:hypothetical protein
MSRGGESSDLATEQTVLLLAEDTVRSEPLRSETGAECSLSTGDRVGAWIVDRALAKGGFGAVYRVYHQASGRIAALKVLRAELVENI